jgi:hypothetical protein
MNRYIAVIAGNEVSLNLYVYINKFEYMYKCVYIERDKHKCLYVYINICVHMNKYSWQQRIAQPMYMYMYIYKCK